MNVRLLRKIQKVLSDPEKKGQFSMLYWHREKKAFDGAGRSVDALCKLEKENQISCNTTHCIAGWAQAIDPKRDCNKPAEVDAKRLLGLTEDEGSRLFYADNWPKGFGGWNATRAKAAARIEHFIKTKGAE